MGFDEVNDSYGRVH